MTDDLKKRLNTMGATGWNPIGYEALERINQLEAERDQLREHVKMLRDELNTVYKLVPDLVVLMEPSALAAMEDKYLVERGMLKLKRAELADSQRDVRMLHSYLKRWAFTASDDECAHMEVQEALAATEPKTTS